MTIAQVVLLLAVLLLATQAGAATFALAHGRQAQATILLARQPTASAEFAAVELQHHILRISGAELPIVQEPARVEGPRILVGESRSTRRLGLRSEDFDEQEYLIRFAPDTLILIGRDGPSAADASQPTWITGRFDKALRLDGLDDGLAVGDCGFDDAIGSLECWVRLSPQPQEQEGTLLRLDGGGPWTYHILRRVANTNSVGYYTYDGTQVRGVVSAELSDGWHHILATHDLDAGVAELFLDGILQGSMQYNKTTCQGARLDIGGLRRSPGFQNALNGDLDEIRVSCVVRTPDDDATGRPYEGDDTTTFLAHLDEGRGRPILGDGPLASHAMPDLFDPNGTLYAVYDFLERYCGVRWYAPGEIGTVLPVADDLVVHGTVLRRKPAMRHRWITPTPLYMPTTEDVLPPTEVDLWKLRMRIGGEAFWTCHSFGGYYERFGDTHPEFFAKGYEGRPLQVCYTEPGLSEQVIQDARDYFDGKGSHAGASNRGPYFGIVPEDNSAWCKCPRCQVQMDASDESNQQFSRGIASNYIWGFVNKVAREVRKTHPDKWISALAYFEYAYYPTEVELEPNIAVQMCLHTRNWWAPHLARNDQRIFDEWVKKSEGERPLYLWLYYNFPGWLVPREHFKVFPGFFAHTVIEQMRMYHDAGIRGIFMEHSAEGGQSFLLDQLDMYVTLRLADDPGLDGKAVIDEFFTRYYGAAAESMKALYIAIEETYSDPANYPPEVQNADRHFHQTEEMAWGWLGTEERMVHFGNLMQQAGEAAETDMEKTRVEMFDRGVWQPMVAGRREWLEKQQ